MSAPKPPQRIPTLTPQEKSLMMGILLQNPQAFAAMRDQLKPEEFDEFDRAFGLAWQAANIYFNDYQELPPRELINSAVMSMVVDRPDLLNGEEVTSFGEFLDLVYDPKTYRGDVTTSTPLALWAIAKAKQLRQEQIQEKLRRVVADTRSSPVDLPAILEHLQTEAAAVEVAGLAVDEVAFPENWDREAQIVIEPTKLAFLDDFMGGGTADGEVYGLMGPYGSCKTTLAAMLGVNKAMHYHEAHQKKGGKPKLAFVVTYEARIKEMRQRTLGYAAKIRRKVMETMKSVEDLSTADSMRDYERELFAAELASGKPGARAGERERARGAVCWINRHLKLLDMTGHYNKGWGNGYIREIATRINQVLRARDADCGLVVVDYVGAMVKRHMAAGEMDDARMRHLVGGAPLEAKSKIADAFNCPVLLIHQFSGASNKYSPGKVAHHTDAAEAKNFAENLDFSFSVGKPDKEGRAFIECTKHRRFRELDPRIIRVDGEMYRVLDVDDRYRWDPQVGKFVSAADAERLADGPQPPPPPADPLDDSDPYAED